MEDFIRSTELLPERPRAAWGRCSATSLVIWTHVLASKDYAHSVLHNVGHCEHARLSPGCSRHSTRCTPSSVPGERYSGRGDAHNQVHTWLSPWCSTRLA